MEKQESSARRKPNLFQQLSRQTLANQITEQVCEFVVTGSFAAHEAIVKGKLAQQLVVSRAPVREALLTLEREGLIESLETGRRRVRKLTATDFDELLDIRIALESRSCYLLANCIADEVVRRLESSIEKQADCKILLELSMLDIECNTVILKAAGNHQELQESIG